MRITMQSIHKNILTNLNTLTEDMNRINMQISSGKQMSKISEDPVSLVTALGLRTDITEITQYQDNIQFGDSMITAAETALTQMKELAIRAKTLALQQNNASVSVENRANAAVEVKNLWEEAIFVANTEVNGKYVFAGYRTSGYSDVEPEPFIPDLIDGYQVNGSSLSAIDTSLTSTIDNTPPANLVAGDLLINGTDIGAVDLNGVVNGLNMGGAFRTAAAINGAVSPTVTATLTTLYAGAAANDTGSAPISFDLNGVTISLTTGGAGNTQVAQDVADAINNVKDLTGIEAVVGNATGTNGGPTDSVILRNIQLGDDTPITITNLSAAESTLTGISNSPVGGYIADATHNTGQISLTPTESFIITTSAADDTILARVGLDGGGLGFADVAGDGTLTYGPELATGDLTINGTPIGATSSDGISTVYSDASAAAKAAAINAVSSTTEVSAEITPASRTAGTSVQPGTLSSGDLVINGIDIFDGSSATNPDPATVLIQDSDNVVLDAINAKIGSTGVVATRDSNGYLTLTAIDGRNIQVTTTANGENITHLNGATANTPASKVYFGTIQLKSPNQFMLETTPVGTAPTIYEPGLDALGLGGGGATTGESKDIAEDGKLQVITIQQDDGNVRYAGDRDHDLGIKVGQNSTLDISKNGQSAVMDTGVFSTLKAFEYALRGENFSTVTGIQTASDTTALLNSGNTGLEQDSLSFTNGTISVTVTDHSYHPPQDFTMDIGVDTAKDTPSSIAAKLHGIPGLTASWDSNGNLKVETTDTDRYTFDFTDTSNFMELSGITNEQMQLQAIDKSIADLETLMESLTEQISDFGARANRISVQNQIYINLSLATKENLSEKEDTDLVKALMEVKAKEVAYEAALSAAAKTMQLSLVNFLN